MTPHVIAFIFAIGVAIVIVRFPEVIISAIEWLDYRIKLLIAKIINFFDQP